MSNIIQEIVADPFPRYDAIPAWFKVESVFRVEVMGSGLGGLRLVEWMEARNDGNHTVATVESRCNCPGFCVWIA